MGSGSVKEISLGDDFGEVIVNVNHARVGVHADGSVETYPSDAPSGTLITKPAPANDSLAHRALEVGERLRDGTVVIAVDLKNNKALFAAAAIFGGNAKFDDQHEIPEKLNKQNTHGYSDWRNITDDEGKTLSQVWDKVAPNELKGRAAPWFWLASPDDDDYYLGRVRRGGFSDWGNLSRLYSFPVPVVRSGPAVV